MSSIGIGADGMPVLFANVPNAGVSNISTTQRSGNPRHDAHSGKFGAGGGGDKPAATARPANTDPHEYARMLAAARDAAREFDNPQAGDIKEFLAGRARDPKQVDVQGFLDMVRQQRISDLADLLDNQFRLAGDMKQGRRKVRLAAPKGYVRKAVKNLQPSEVDQLISVIVSRGHDEAQVKTFFNEKGYDHVTLSDEYGEEVDSLV